MKKCLIDFVFLVAAKSALVSSFSAPNRKNVALNVATLGQPSLVDIQVKDSDPKPSLLKYDKDGFPKIGSLMRALPDESFNVDTATSLFYFGIDSAAVIACMGFLYSVVSSDFYHSMQFWQQAAMVTPLQVLSGFAMWCLWCIGHDAGHSLISKDKKWLNDVVGEISHSVFCLTPFVPWQLSHKKHHMNHNHLEKDYSHQWFIKENRDELVWWIKASHATRNFQLPILYLVYLLVGVPDGGHVIPYGRLWEDETFKTKLRGMGSSLVSIITAGTLLATMGTADFTVVCFVPWLVMSFWLFMVTYLQHHSDDGKLYTDDTYTFVKGAFETVDRSYGKLVNRMSHHMMDGHVVHHLFFEKVPHYQLEDTTVALKQILEEEGRGDLYKFIETEDYTQEIMKQFDENWFFVNEKQIVRE
mmetsp:Transcript_22608/g.51800  ORF Transcript_22608/g.51800 Transcript_22608/m.51800 type:complete len:415 (-) Transcript_22608:54-1298(-)|eukprot:CAMPEP_0113309720 /NCGR_PEP_ID=MMETSP0010_2-20120614/7649_1 /TAXON_ID=216773 ORGANISM="Corethron hystrix, Strain 308" /NCGR_SAMPLE_ID=MMETSP0010_2 /ASSEMBLY_ACC=CAM_ASM_000155 /LENGTH=414 /DNA_ID=CAMNT_0000165025 /DNA_START=76 /DNA_END=1320 /DNA_ORIENTATION=+ /assembly_acc=CAM_ASM_000155